MSKYNNVTHLVHYSRTTSCECDKGGVCREAQRGEGHSYLVLSAVVHRDGYRITDRVLDRFKEFGGSYRYRFSTARGFSVSDYRNKKGLICMYIEGGSDANINEFLEAALWNRSYKIIKCRQTFDKISDYPYIGKADIINEVDGFQEFIRNESAKIIQNYWRDARLNPYCRLGNRTINKFYDEYMNDLESKK